jgi:hypothetical protein
MPTHETFFVFAVLLLCAARLFSHVVALCADDELLRDTKAAGAFVAVFFVDLALCLWALILLIFAPEARP